MFLKKNLVVQLPSFSFLVSVLLGDKRMLNIKVLVSGTDLRIGHDLGPRTFGGPAQRSFL